MVVNPQDLAPSHSGSVFGLMNTFGSIPGKRHLRTIIRYRTALNCFSFAGFLGVYLAGHILELTQSWPAVFSTAALINTIGWVLFTVFGSAQSIV